MQFKLGEFNNDEFAFVRMGVAVFDDNDKTDVVEEGEDVLDEFEVVDPDDLLSLIFKLFTFLLVM